MHLGSACAAEEIVDQGQTETDGSSSRMLLTDTDPAAQTFTFGLYGALNWVRVKLENHSSNPASGPIIVSIQTTTDQGLPSGKEIERGEIPVDKIPAYGSGSQWVDVSINPATSSPVIMEAGTKYALLLIPSDGAAYWYQSQSDFYDGGAMLVRLGITWRTYEQYEGPFETYILEPVLDQHPEPRGDGSHTMAFSVIGEYDYTIAQTFTAGMSGLLDRVSIKMGLYWQDSGTYRLTGDVTIMISPIRWAGIPEYDMLAVGTIPFEETQTLETWVDIRLSSLYYVNKGQQYAIRVLPDQGRILWYLATPYSGGSRYAHVYVV